MLESIDSGSRENFLNNRLLLWQENQKSPKRIESQNFRFGVNVDANCVGVPVASIVNLESVEFAFAILLTKG